MRLRDLEGEGVKVSVIVMLKIVNGCPHRPHLWLEEIKRKNILQMFRDTIVRMTQS